MWTCTSGTSADCVESDPFDPSIRTIDGEAICYYCALTEGIVTPRE